MGTWGQKLYENDTTLDVRDEFEQLFKEGTPVSEITDQMIREYQSIMGNRIEEPLFWFALADTQWDYGVLLPEVREKAFYWIETILTLIKNHTQSQAKQPPWAVTLEQLNKKLLSQQPEKKEERKKSKRTRKVSSKFPWNIGDVYAYQLRSELAQKRNLNGRYLLFHKIAEYDHPGAKSIIKPTPIIYIRLTADDHLPTNMKEFEQTEYIQTWSEKYEDRFLPLNFNRLLEDLAEKAKINYKTNEYGYLPVYRARLYVTKDFDLLPQLIYLGNFSNVTPPENEFIPHETLNIIHYYWEKIDGKSEIETKAIECYCKHNLRESLIYHQGRESTGNNPLITAARALKTQELSVKAKRTVALLLAMGADPSAKDDAGKTAYDYAVENGNTELAELLKP